MAHHGCFVHASRKKELNTDRLVATPKQTAEAQVVKNTVAAHDDNVTFIGRNLNVHGMPMAR